MKYLTIVQPKTIIIGKQSMGVQEEIPHIYLFETFLDHTTRTTFLLGQKYEIVNLL